MATGTGHTSVTPGQRERRLSVAECHLPPVIGSVATGAVCAISSQVFVFLAVARVTVARSALGSGRMTGGASGGVVASGQREGGS